jgi:2-keto-4-pentenoate hydratase/2-oxohepta-3-ene-1,7-dioic acid hydratase in catechol pathway
MKFVTYIRNGSSKVGLMDEQMEHVIDLHAVQKKVAGKNTIPVEMVDCLRNSENFLKDVHELIEHFGNQTEYRYPLAEIEIQAPIPRPAKNIFCVGKNYAAHAIEMGSEADIPEHPMIFSKTPTTVVGPEATVLHHRYITECLDYEGELAVIIGKEGKDIHQDEAFDYVFGYTIINDVSARDRQKRHKQFLLGKSLDTSCPMGPYITHKSQILDPHNLNIETKVNGEVRQFANTEQFIFDIPTIISVISAGTTLEPGDIIATGTPAGVGNGFKPPRFLQPGDLMEITVDGLGTLRNSIQS